MTGIAIALQSVRGKIGMAVVLDMDGEWVQYVRYASQCPSDQLA